MVSYPSLLQQFFAVGIYVLLTALMAYAVRLFIDLAPWNQKFFGCRKTESLWIEDAGYSIMLVLFFGQGILLSFTFMALGLQT